jgi:CHAT domain-containing protein
VSRSALWVRAGVLCVFWLGIVPAQAQESRWDQLSTQVVQLMDQDNAQAALPLAQQAERVAEATWGPGDVHVAITLGVLANLNLELEKLSDAEANLKQALAIYSRLEGPEGKDIANELANLGGLYEKEANYPAAEQATRQALAIDEKLQGANSPAVATAASNLALILKHEDKYADAEPLFQKAIAIELRLGRSGEAATSLDGLGTLYLAMRKYADAEQAYGQAVELDVKTPASDHPNTGLALSDLATAYQEEGKFAAAEQMYARAMAFAQKEQTPDQALIAGIEQDVGALFRDEGKYPQAEALLVQALTSRARVLGPYHPEVASILADLAGLYEFETRYSDADRALQQAVAIDLRSLGPQHLETARLIVQLAELHGDYGDYAAADKLYHDAIPIYLKVLGENDERVADVSYNAASVLRREQKYEDATKVATASAAIYLKVDGDSSRGYARSLDLLAAIAEDGRGHDVAEKLHRQALAIYEKIDGPDSLEVSDSLEGLARILKDEQKFADAEPLYQKQLKIEQSHATPHSMRVNDAEADLASLYYAWGKPEQAAPYFQMYLGDLMEEFRSNAATMSERDRLYYLAAYRNAFPMFFSFVTLFHKQMPELTGRMYDAILQEKGMIAQNAAAMRAAVEASGDPQAVAMLDKLTGDKAQVAALAESTVGDPANYHNQMNQLASEANALEGELLQRSSVLSRQKAQDAATWQDVQKALKPGEAAVEIVRFQVNDGISPSADQAYVALVVTPDCKQPELVLLGKAKDLEAAPMLAYRSDVGQTRGLAVEETPAAPGQPENAANTSAAYAAFWKPLEPALSGASRVYVSPDGVLNTIPMGLMTASDGELLMEKIQLRIVNSTKDLLLPSRSAQSKSALLVGNPTFDLTLAQQKSAMAELRGGAAGAQAQQGAAPAAQISNAGAAQTASRSGDLKGGDLPPLPGTQVEVDTVDKLLKTAGWQSTEYTAELALKDAVTQAQAPRVVHIATHGFFLSDEELQANASAEGTKANVNEDPMLRAGLFFAGADRVRQGAAPEAGVDDGVLTAYEASQLNLEGTELVVLSACETGLGKDLNVDGVFGLRRGLEEAGADAVMMSMWSVPDKETQELMSLFYQKWLGGMEKPEALRQAQLEERETVKKRYGKDLPFYWGAFVLIGR